MVVLVSAERIDFGPWPTDPAALARAEELSAALEAELNQHGQTVRAVRLYEEAQRVLNGLGFPAESHVGDRIKRGLSRSRVIVDEQGRTNIVNPDGSGTRFGAGSPQQW